MWWTMPTFLFMCHFVFSWSNWPHIFISLVSKLKSPARHNEWHRLVILIPRKPSQEDHEAGPGFTVSRCFTVWHFLQLHTNVLFGFLHEGSCLDSLLVPGPSIYLDSCLFCDRTPIFTSQDLVYSGVGFALLWDELMWTVCWGWPEHSCLRLGVLRYRRELPWCHLFGLVNTFLDSWENFHENLFSFILKSVLGQ